MRPTAGERPRPNVAPSSDEGSQPSRGRRSDRGLARWRIALFRFLLRRERSVAQSLGLPPDRVVELDTPLDP